MKIPFFSLARQTQKLKPEILELFSDIIDSQHFIGGSRITQIEQKLADYLGVKHVISCNSGTDALWMAVKAMNVKPGDLVLTTPFSFIASSSELIPHGAQPIFIDCEKDSFNLDVKALREWLENNTEHRNGITIHKTTQNHVVGIIPVHLFGQCVDFTALQEVAEDYHLWIIEDTAQAIGSEYNGKKAGTMGDIGTYSFYPTKNLGAFGDAGCCVTNDARLAETLLRLRNHGRKSHYHYEGYGLNSRLDALQAAVLDAKLPHLETYNNKRRAIAQYYNERLKNLEFLTLPQEKYGKHTYHQYSVLVRSDAFDLSRDDVAAHLAERGIETRIFYPQSLREIAYLNEHVSLANECPNAEAITQSILALPIWPELTNEELNYICTALEELAQPSVYLPVSQQVLHG